MRTVAKQRSICACPQTTLSNADHLMEDTCSGIPTRSNLEEHTPPQALCNSHSLAPPPSPPGPRLGGRAAARGHAGSPARAGMGACGGSPARPASPVRHAGSDSGLLAPPRPPCARGQAGSHGGGHPAPEGPGAAKLASGYGSPDSPSSSSGSSSGSATRRGSGTTNSSKARPAGCAAAVGSWPCARTHV